MQTVELVGRLDQPIVGRRGCACELLRDDRGGLDSALERTRDECRERCAQLTQVVARRARLLSANVGEMEAGRAPVAHVGRVVDLAVADQMDSALHRAATLSRRYAVVRVAVSMACRVQSSAQRTNAQETTHGFALETVFDEQRWPCRDVAPVRLQPRTLELGRGQRRLAGLLDRGEVELHPAACTPGFTMRGDIAPLATHSMTHALLERLMTLDCSPHSVRAAAGLRRGGPDDGRSQLFQYYLLDTTGFQPSVFTTIIPGVNDDRDAEDRRGANCDLSDHRRGAPRARAEAGPADRPRRSARVHRHLHRHPRPVRHQQRERLVRGLDDPRPPGRAGRRRATSDGHAQFGTITARGRRRCSQRWAAGNNVPGQLLHRRRQGAALPEPERSLPGQGDQRRAAPAQHGRVQLAPAVATPHYWEFNYTTNWIHPLYELPFTGGFPDIRRRSRPTRTRTARSALCSRSCPATAAGVATAAPRRGRVRRQPRPARAIRTSSTPRTTRSASSASASSRAASRTRRSSTSSSGSRRSSPTSTTSTQRLLDGYRPRSRSSTPTTTASSRPSRATSTRRTRTAPHGRQHLLLPAAAQLQPLRRHARDQRRPARAALRAEHARLGAVGHACHRLRAVRGLGGTRTRTTASAAASATARACRVPARRP